MRPKALFELGALLRDHHYAADLLVSLPGRDCDTIRR